jgi:hypothetical protein
MSSVWGKSWGGAWGASWGALLGAVAPAAEYVAPLLARRRKRKPEEFLLQKNERTVLDTAANIAVRSRASREREMLVM